MTDPIVDLEYLDYDGARAAPVRRPVIAETPWVLYLERRALLTFMCTPLRLHCLALGFLLSEGLIGSLEDIWQVRVVSDEDRLYLLFPEAGIDEERHQRTCPEAAGSILVRLRRPAPPPPERRILTSGCGGGVSFDDLSAGRAPLQSDLRLPAASLAALMRDMQQHANLYNQSRGVHTSALYDPHSGAQLVMAEDVGRHNTLDKIRGECLLAGLPTAGRVLVTSGRISSEMLGKAHRMGAPIVASRTSPTATSVRLAQSWGVTLVGYLRGSRMRVYAGAERVLFP